MLARLPGPAGPSPVVPGRSRSAGLGSVEAGPDPADLAAELALAERLPCEPGRRLAAAGLFAGAASTALAMQPVAQTLGEVSVFLGRREAAARHFAAAERVAERWNSPHWAARARAAATRR